MKKLAVFDIDGTIFRNSLFIELFNNLVESGLFPKEANIRVKKELNEWVNRNKTFSDYAKVLVDSFFTNLKGLDEKKVSKVGSVVVVNNQKKVYRYTRELIKKFKSKGYFLLALSGSPFDLAEGFSRYHKFDSVIGSKYEIKSGQYTGKIEFDSFSNKAKVLKDFIKNSNLSFDLENSFAVGDTKDDISMLEMVGNPIAFNPSFELAEIAKKNGWKIVVERKDVIYEINNFEFIL